MLGQLHGTALFQHLADELGAEIVPAALPADMHPAECKTDDVEPVKAAVGHHVLGTTAGTDVGFIAHIQRIQCAGHVLPQTEHTPVQVFPAGPCREHGIAVFAGRAVQAAQVFVKSQRSVGIICTGNSVNKV